MAENLTLGQSNLLVPTSVPINDLKSNLNVSWDNFQAIQTQFNALNAQVTGGLDVGGQQHFTDASYDPASEVLTFTRQNTNTLEVNLGAAPTTPRLSELILTDIAAFIDEDVSLVGDHTLTYHVSSSSLVNSLNLIINSTTVHTLTAPASDGRKTVSFNISQGEWDAITGTMPTTLAVLLQGEDTAMNEISSNTVTVTRVGDERKLFYGLRSTNDFDTAVLSSFQSHVIQGAGDTVDVTIGPSTAGQFIGILDPQTFPLTSIQNRDVSNHEVLDTFTRTLNVRTIEGQAFNSAVIGPVNGGLTQRYRFTL